MKKILIVDDDELFREAIAEMISIFVSDEYEFTFAENGKEALDKIILGADSFQALITDFNMPIMDGGELVKELIKREIMIPKIVILSGLVLNEMKLDEILGANSHIVFQIKPFPPSRLIELLEDNCLTV